MAGPPCGNPEYGAGAGAGAGAAAPNLYVPIHPRSELNFNSATGLQNSINGLIGPHHEYAEFVHFISELLGPDDLHIGDLVEPLSHSPAATTSLDDQILSYGRSNRPPPYSASSSTSMPTHLLQESTICHLRPQVYERSPSRTFFVAPPPSPSKVFQMQCLPGAPATDDNKATVPLHPWSTRHSLHQLDATFASDFAFYPHHSDYTLFDGFDTAVSKASPSSYMPPASAMGFHIYASNIMAEDPKSILSPENLLGRSPSVQSLEHPLSGPINSTCLAMKYAAASPTSMDSNAGAFPDSAAMEFSSASAAILSSSPSTYLTSMLNFEGMSLSAGPSFNYMGAALHESFQSTVEDLGAGSQLVGSINSQGDLYKLHQYEDTARRTAQGGIHKRRTYSRRTSLSAPYLQPNSVNDDRNFPPLQDSEVKIRVKTQNLSLHDGYVWRKYGKKTIKNDTHTRNYMRCEESKRRGCNALKRTQRCSLDEEYVDFFYLGKHNHPP